MRVARLALAVVSTSALAVVAAACSDPVPPTPQGAFDVRLVSSSTCKIIGHTTQVGSVTSSSKDNVLVAGALVAGDSVDVTCQVTGTSSFAVSGVVSLAGEALQIEIPKIDSSATEDKPATGSISFSSSKTAGAYASSDASPCNFYFLPSTGEGVASGRIWAAFSCPKVDDKMSTCSLSESFVIFENCTE